MTERIITLIESEDKEPKLTIKLRPGTQVEMVEVRQADKAGKAMAGRAALCGYGNACLALVEVGEITEKAK